MFGEKKICSKCKQEKKTSEFYKQSSKKDGLHPYCKECVSIIDTSPQRKTYMSKYLSEYAKTEKRKTYASKYLSEYMKTENGKKVSRRKSKIYAENNPQKIKARNKMKTEIKAGRLPKASRLKCSCGEQAKEYHHYNGYGRGHELDIIPLCKGCHNKAHNPPSPD